jgi:penicillin-binding protein 2
MVGLHRDGDRAKLFSRRMAMLGAGKAALISALVGRMYYLQIVEAEKYRTLAEENRINLRLLPPPRGRITDRFGVPLAVNQQNFRVLLVSEQARDVGSTLDALATIIPLGDHDRQRVVREVRRKRSFVPVTVRENLSWEEMARIQVNAPDLPGVVIDEGLARYYPYAEQAGHVLGYVAAVSEDDLTGDPLLELPGFRIGKAGIEREFDLALRGKGGTSQVEVNALGRVIRELSREEGEPGAEVELTLDARLQQSAYRALNGQSGTCVVMDVMTGDVLALASTPGYDPNAFNRGLTPAEWKDLVSNPKAPLTNKPIAGQYAPGSTFKMVVAMAALEAGVIKPEQTVFCPGHMTLGNARFHCWKRGGHGHMDMVDALKNSCDVYFYEAAKRLGVDRIAEMANRFGLGTETGINLPGERPGLIPTRAWKQAALGDIWHKGETLIAGIGQGYILATPLQLAVMTARVANGGIAVTPRLTRYELSPDGHLVDRPKAEGGDLGVSRTALQIVQRGMWEVVNGHYGTAWRAALPTDLGQMAGKTGTAQVRRITKAEREAGVFKNEDLPWERRDHALFVCYAPFDAPRYAIAVVVEHGGGGSAVAAPIARAVMMDTLTLDPARRGAEVAVDTLGSPPGGDAAVAAAEREAL